MYRKNAYGIILNDDEEEQETPKEASPQEDPMMKEFLKTRTVLVSGEINKALAERVISRLIMLEALGDDPIKVFIDSPGGDADAGFAIFDMMRFINAPVYTIGMGLVASAASIIQLAAPKERRMGLPNSHYLIHQPLSGIRGVATEIEIHAREIEKIKLRINELIALECEVPLEQVVRDTDRDFWMNAEEAVKYNLISKIVKTRKEANL